MRRLREMGGERLEHRADERRLVERVVEVEGEANELEAESVETTLVLLHEVEAAQRGERAVEAGLRGLEPLRERVERDPLRMAGELPKRREHAVRPEEARPRIDNRSRLMR